MEININKYQCIKGSQYIPLPTPIQKKHACINVQNNAQYCFKWAIISAIYLVNNSSKRTTSCKINNITPDIITLENCVI